MDHGRLSLIVLLIIFVLGGFCLARYSGGTGESNSPYEISTANDLNDIHKYTEDCNKHFVVTADIDMNGFDFNSALIGRDTNPSQGGFQGSSFTGSFDGMDHVVRNLRVEAASNYYIGLFGRIGHEGRVSNLRLEDISVTGKGSTGGLAGYNHGRISNCYVSGYINGGDSVGGLVGFDNGRIENCSVAVTVQGDWYAGGLVGQCGGLIYDCNALGNVNGSNYVGGLAGYCEMSDVWDSNSGCDVNGTDYVGGLIGYHYLGDVFFSRASGVVTGNDYVGGLIGKYESGRLISSHASCEVEGNNNVGGFLGHAYCYCTNSSAGSSVVGIDNVGGFAGYSEGLFFMCFSSGDVNGYSNVGGLFGYNEGDFTADNCYSAANVFGQLGFENHGGLVGYNNGATISNSYASGFVESVDCSGKLVGLNSGTVSNCLWDEDVNGVGLAIGCNNGGTELNVLGKSTSQMQDMQTYTDVGWDFAGELANGADDFWQIPSGGGYPEFGSGRTAWYDWSTNSGDGSVLNPYQVSTVEQFLSIGWNTKLLDKSFVLTSDIDFSGHHCRVAVIAPFGLFFNGIFDGCGYELSELEIRGKADDFFSSVFGSVDSAGEVKNLIVRDAIVSGGGWVAGLAGQCKGDISNSRFSGSVDGVGAVGGVCGQLMHGEVVNVCSSGSVTGIGDIGGLVGLNFEGTIQRSYSDSSITGENSIGGLVGLSFDGVIVDSYSRGDVNGINNSSKVGGLIGSYEDSYSAEITNCYATGTVEGNDYVGGLVGYSWAGAVYSGCFWDIDINPGKVGIGNRSDPNVISKTTSELQTMTTFVDVSWDFLTVWDICEGSNYPKLMWQQPIIADFGCPDGVDGFDFSHFASRWEQENCGESNDCEGVDFDFSGVVDWLDFGIFCDYWLTGVSN